MRIVVPFRSHCIPQRLARPRDPPALRLRAKDECARGEWKACVDDLDRATALDPGGDTEEIHALRKGAAQKVRSEKPANGTR